MSSWKQFPLIRLFPFYILGIIGALFIQENYFLLNVMLALILGSLFIILNAQRVNPQFKTRWVYGVLAGSFLLLAGYQLTILNSERFDPLHILHAAIPEQNQDLTGTVVDTPVKKEGYWKVVAEVDALNHGDNWNSYMGKVLLYLEYPYMVLPLTIGDRFIARSCLKKPKGPRKPGAFNYQEYLYAQQIFLVGNVEEDGWEQLGAAPRYPLKRIGGGLHKKSISFLKQLGLSGDSFGVAAALLLGAKENLDKETRMAFSKAGTMHILAVSGLHVGIIYLLFNSLFKFLGKEKWSRVIKTVALLFILWTYALVTGLSPSVVRATTMFSFFVIGNAMNKDTNVLNIVFVSLFILLILDPYLLLSVGFQLSYAAVITIVILYPWLYKRIIFKNFLADKIWAISCVSLCAQIGTLPLVLYYFHQFPNYFLFSNLLVIPLVPVVVVSGLLAFLFFSVPWLDVIFAEIFAFLVNCLIQIVGFFEKLPHAVSTGIFPDITEVVMTYGLITCLITWLLYKRKWYFVFALGILFSMVIKSIWDQSL